MRMLSAPFGLELRRSMIDDQSLRLATLGSLSAEKAAIFSTVLVALANNSI